MALNYRAAMLAVLAAGSAFAQQTPPRTPAPGGQARRPGRGPRGANGERQGGFVPGQERAPGDPAQIERGKTIYGISCRGCHGADLRGGDMGGPNLLRTQTALLDRDGELIVPVIQGSRQSTGMPAIQMSPADANAVAAYVRSIVATIGRQGMPPSIGREAPSVVVGDAAAGKQYFAAKCSGCHSVTGELKSIASRISDPKILQNTWVAGGERLGRGPGRGGPRNITAAVTLQSGERVEGRLVRIDDFLVTVALADGTSRTFRREGDVPKVEVHDPRQAHMDLLPVLTDKDMHDVTAYLVTLK
jgi:cytochrome c oxidase cbb3-type subunit III